MNLSPYNVLDNTLVFKTFTPEVPGNFTGGMVDVYTSDFPDSLEISFKDSTGYYNLSNINDNFLGQESSSTEWLGYDDGSRDIPNFILLPRAADELEIPFVASGGMADARSLVAAMALGAEGMNMGTRFIATQDAPVHQNVKEAIVNATELDTRLIMRSLTNTERVLNNEAVERLMEKEKALGDKLRFEDIVDEVAGVYPKIMHEGTMEAGAWSCGMVAGLVNDIPTVEELISGIMSEADEIIKSRLSGF